MSTQTHDWEDGFLVVGNNPALDLLNTKLEKDGSTLELLPLPAALERWLNVSGLATLPELKSALHNWSDSEEADLFLKDLLIFRENLRDAVLRLEAGELPRTHFLEELNCLLRAHPVRSAIAVTKARLEHVQSIGTTLTDTLWSLIAAQVLKLFTELPMARIRKCESCVVHFLDTSKKGSRRWCSMSLCGNRIKVASYQRRQRWQDSSG